MKWLTRPSVMALASAALVVGAALLVLRSPPAQSKPAPAAVADADREIVWLYTATNPASWERFVASVRRAGKRLREGGADVEAQVGDAAFPKQTTAVPEVALSLPGVGRRLVFRWYKLTSDWKTRDWVEALMRRQPPPLAIIGGSSSDAARELAWQLQKHDGAVPQANLPLLLLTTATADRVSDPDDPDDAHEVKLTQVYPKRTFRFCFTNKQMAKAVMDFVLSQDDLRPDVNPVHMVQWDDDSYSHDLTDGFRDALPPTAALPNPKRIASSVGSFLSPNRFEADVVDQVLQDLDRTRGQQRRPLLAVTGQATPSRRFLRELARTSPGEARRLLIVTGDAVSFNTVYRDRRVTWPIQDLPFPLVFFCHYNPIDADAGFRAEGEGPHEGETEQDVSTTGTEDILLDGDIVEALAQAFGRGGRPAADAGELSERLAAVTRRKGHVGYDPEGVRMFLDDGNRQGGAGEHIVLLRPHFGPDRILPEASVEVWVGRGAVHADEPFRRIADPLNVSYEPPVVEERLAP